MTTNERKGWYIKQSFNDDFVELMEKLYKKYGEKIFAIQGIANEHMDIVKFSKKFFKSANVADASIDSNANISEKNIVQYNYEVGKATMKLNSIYVLYKWIKKLYKKDCAEKAIEKIINGEIFVNDLTNLAPYCYAFDLDNLMRNGMDFFGGNIKIHAPTRSDSFMALIIQTTAYISNQICGAIAYPSFFISLNYFYQKELGKDYTKKFNEKEIWYKIKNQFQNLIFSLCFPFRGGQAAFTNLSIMDKGFLKQLFGDYVYPDGTKPDIDSVLALSKKFFEYFTEINGKEGMFTFPVMTLAISLNEKTKEYLDPEFVEWAAKVNCEKSFANIFQSPPTAYSSCCRLRLELDKVANLGYQNSFGVGGVSIGSHRIVGLNLPRIALLEKENPNVIKEDLEIVRKILTAHRKYIIHRVETGSLPLYKFNWISINRQYSTVGLLGGYEYVLNKGLDIKTDEGTNALVGTLKVIEEHIKVWQEEGKKEKQIFNIEAIPAESMALRCAQIDSELGFNPKKHKLYSNQYIPLIENASVFDRFKIQGKIDGLTSGGAILHINVDDEKPLTPKQFRKLIQQAKDSNTVYFAVNYAYSECEKHHYTVGKKTECPICKGKIINTYSRVVGFITPTSSWNSVRRDYEFNKRVFYTNDRAIGEAE